MTTIAIDTTTPARALITLTSEPTCADHLPRGRADGRYECPACHEQLFLQRWRTDPEFVPRFLHYDDGGAGKGDICRADPGIRQRIDEGAQVVINLQDRLTKAVPGVATTIRDPGDLGVVDALPPHLVATPGGQTVVIECLPPIPTRGAVGRRIKAVRERYGPGVTHVWFHAKDPLQFAQAASQEVYPLDMPKTTHAHIAPTQQQLDIVAAGGRVLWVDGLQVLVPYGRHEYEYEAEAREYWPPYRKGMKDWRGRRDWRISHPVPAPDAGSWGLVPLTLEQLGRGRVAFHPADAYKVMAALEARQPRREAANRKWARLQREALQEHAAPTQPVPVIPPMPKTPPAIPAQAPVPDEQVLEEPSVYQAPEPAREPRRGPIPPARRRTRLPLWSWPPRRRKR